ncbi:Hypothetical protein NTJ_15577 [Nesidiocoris tenuis]|uniref:Uncharacterized protein n=1 Tax=Nesidiocoris tenuis TaxID=355587 RepID=A0ABN7BER1_9HEMI|nr:Hypothetical protein NTJ_15577 [Nesidiocoris tenuis]
MTRAQFMTSLTEECSILRTRLWRPAPESAHYSLMASRTGECALLAYGVPHRRVRITRLWRPALRSAHYSLMASRSGECALLALPYGVPHWGAPHKPRSLMASRTGECTLLAYGVVHWGVLVTRSWRPALRSAHYPRSLMASRTGERSFFKLF